MPVAAAHARTHRVGPQRAEQSPHDAHREEDGHHEVRAKSILVELQGKHVFDAKEKGFLFVSRKVFVLVSALAVAVERTP